MTNTQTCETRKIYFSNYNIDDYVDCAKENLTANGIEDFTETDIWNNAQDIMCDEWEDLYYQLKRFFSNPYGYLLQGEVGRWDGIRRGGFIFNGFVEMWYKATKDCDYFELSEDEEGNFFIRCSHHDGDNSYEIRALTKDGYDLYDNWTYDYDDKRSSAEIHDLIMSSDTLSKAVNFTKYAWN